ncbi:MAG: FG-GAP-like repeat-containing protein [Gemmatimonadota bacterium]
MGIARTALLAALCAGALPACDRAAEPVWHDEPGHRWAELSPGFWNRTGFRPLDASRTGIHFANRVSEAQIAENRHYMSGSGVATGDVDGDGRVDVYFASLTGANRLYRNDGGLRFTDITEAAGVAHGGRYSTGAVLVDVDGDADLDLLVSSVHENVALYENDGSGRFRPVADAGLSSTKGKGSTTLALADIDADGDLDLYVTNYRERAISDLMETLELSWDRTIDERYSPEIDDYTLLPPFDEYYTILERDTLVPERREVGERDQLFINEGGGRFSEATDTDRFLSADGTQGGLHPDWGLTARFQDLNGDRLPDLYVANDFWTTDRVWINQGAGVFRAIDPLAIRNFSFSSMAVDFADVDRNGAVDIFTTEMLSPLHRNRARHYIPRGPYPDLPFEIEGQPLYNRNSLQANRGDGTFAEVSYFAGVEASEWSWAAQFVDVDLDGYEDLVITTGFSYDLQDLDTQLRIARDVEQGARRSIGSHTDYPAQPLTNRAFRNNGDLTFADVSGDWGFEDEDISHGLATADFDNDGDLDIVINRLNDVASVYENTGTGQRIAVRLRGAPPNTQAIGARIEVLGGPVPQDKQIVSGGGYVSGSDPLVVFAAGDTAHTIRVTWADGHVTSIAGVLKNRIYEIDQSSSERQPATGYRATRSDQAPHRTAFSDVSGRLEHRHREQVWDDTRIQPLLPLPLSQQGPGVSWIDHDADGDDLFIASGRGGRMGVFENRGAAGFAEIRIPGVTDSAAGDQTTILGWPERGGLTLVVGNANLEQGNVGAPAAHVHRLGNADVGTGFTIPDNVSTTGPMAAADYDGDGDVDLFVGGRFVPVRYPEYATSRLFRNEQGTFVADGAGNAALAAVGLVTGAVFSDVDGDGDPDLLLSTEWGTIRLFRNEGGRFRDDTDVAGLAEHTGWWNGIATGDFNNDGRMDFVVTNVGLNTPYRVVDGHPPRMYHDDFNWDGRVDIIEAYFDDESESYVPRRQLHEYESIAAVMLAQVTSHSAFAQAGVDDILTHRAGSTPYREAAVLESAVFINTGDGFALRPLPREAQLAPAFAAVVGDYDSDGAEDIFISQNLFTGRPNLPRMDAGRGLWLRGDGSGRFTAVPGHVSGVRVYGAQRGAALSDFDNDGRVDLVVTQNNAATRLFRNQSPASGVRVRLQGPPANPAAIGSSVRLVYDDDSRGPRREVQAGSGYWSQSSSTLVLGAPAARRVTGVEIVWFDGRAAAAAVTPGTGPGAGTQTHVIRYEEEAR